MKLKQYYSWMVAAVMAVATPFLAACSSEENIAPSRGVAITDAHIVINVEPYGATSSAAKSRAAEAPVVTKPDTVLLDNGMRAVVSMEEDAPETQAATRATMDDGHYTIFALDPTTGDRITGTKKQLTGTVTGGGFHSDAGSEMLLDPGTYKFVCINDAVTDHGTWLEVSSGVSNNGYGAAAGTIPTASDAQIGTSTETINGDDWQVTFLMKHQNARFRLRLVAYTNQLENVVGALTGTTTEYPVTLKYAQDGSNPVVTEKTYPYNYAIAKLTLSNTPAESNAIYVKANNFYSNYMYVMPGGDQISLYLGEGKIYGKSFNLASPTSLLTQALPSKTQRNHSYTITYRLLPEFLYLFNDGSCGALAEKGSRTAIAAVVKEKTNTEEGTAIALHKTVDNAMTIETNFNKQSFSVADAMNDMNGYNYTWDAATTIDNKVKATALAPAGMSPFPPSGYRYEPFYYAGHYNLENYNPGVVTSNIGKWYLPALGEWRMAIKEFAGVDIAVQTSLYDTYANWDRQKMKKVFTLAGGDIDVTGGGSGYWESSTLGSDYQRSLYILVNDGYVGVSSDMFNSHGVVPFVHF